MYYTTMVSPIGTILLAREDTIRLIVVQKGRGTAKKPRVPSPEWVSNDQVFSIEIEQLNAYFSGELQTFDMAFELQGTPFQRKVWTALLDIPFGETTTYGAIAQQLGFSKASSRAIGAANGANPISIVIPCHRVIGSTGALVGYGGGLENKAFLLDHERCVTHNL